MNSDKSDEKRKGGDISEELFKSRSHAGTGGVKVKRVYKRSKSDGADAHELRSTKPCHLQVLLQ